jgi:hypothetical protein
LNPHEERFPKGINGKAYGLSAQAPAEEVILAQKDA